MFHRFLAVLLTTISFPHVSIAEVSYPKTRDLVGEGEYYTLDKFRNWSGDCQKDKRGEDVCAAATTLTDLDHSVELDLAITPFFNYDIDMNTDVNTVAYGAVTISPYSKSQHYEKYSAMISKVDGKPFDAYWCPVIDVDACKRGPFLDQADLATLISARSITVSIIERDSEDDSLNVISDIKVDLRGLEDAASRSMKFMAEIWDIDVASLTPEIEMCDFRLEGQQKRISYTYDEDEDIEKQTFREALLGPKGDSSCPSYVTLAYLAPDATSAQRELFCLAFDKNEENILGIQQGEQDAYRACKAPTRSFCQRVNDSKDAALAITGLASGTVGSAVGTTAVTGTTVVMHSSGAAIITGSSGYVAGTLGTLGTSTLGALTAPATVAAAAVSVVAVGGAVYFCSE